MKNRGIFYSAKLRWRSVNGVSCLDPSSLLMIYFREGIKLMIELILVIAVWLVSYFFLPGIMNLYSGELDEKTVNPVQKINFGTINAILFLLLIR